MHYEIYSKPNCPYCENAKKWLAANNHQYTEYLRTDDMTETQKAEWYDSILKKNGGVPVRTVPQIFLVDEGKHTWIGGYNELTTR